jgi:hypothetical protein
VSTLAAPPPLTQMPLVPQGGSASEQLRRSDGGRLTLEQRLDRVWEGLLAAGAADCPVCGGDMERSEAAGRCGDCGSSLA